MTCALLLVLPVGLAVPIPAFAHLGAMLVDAQPAAYNDLPPGTDRVPSAGGAGSRDDYPAHPVGGVASAAGGPGP